LVGSTVLLTAGCATIAPRNVLPQANAGQIELEGFHNIRFWGDASARDPRQYRYRLIGRIWSKADTDVVRAPRRRRFGCVIRQRSRADWLDFLP
jgi:hypothetical protein